MYSSWPSSRLAVLPGSPQEHPLERVEEGSRILELGQETLPIPLQEARPELGRETALVVGQQAPPYPLHDCLARLQLVGVDLQADMLPVKPSRCSSVAYASGASTGHCRS